jgi:arylsulfatase A-like enzyme
VFDNRRKPDLKSKEPTIAQALGQAGYVTGFVGKTHLGGDPRPWGFQETPLWYPEGSCPHKNPKLRVEGVERF